MVDEMEEGIETPVEEAPETKPSAGGGEKVFTGAPPGAREALQKLFDTAMRVVYKKEVTKMILDRIGKAQRPEVGIAQAVLLVMKLIKDAAKGVPPKVIDSMAKPITMMVAELADKAGLIEKTPEMMQMIVQMIQQAIGKVSQQSAQPAQQPAPPAAQPQGMVAGQMGV